jgi:hypothetical protein
LSTVLQIDGESYRMRARSPRGRAPQGDPRMSPRSLSFTLSSLLVLYECGVVRHEAPLNRVG